MYFTTACSWYDRGRFDGFAEAVCQPYYAARIEGCLGPPGRYFRIHLVGYFEGIDSERAAGVALLGFPVATEVPAVEDAGAGAGPFLAVTDPRARCPMKSTRR